MSLKSRIRKGSIWISASRGVVNLLGLLSTIILARLLLPEDFGLVALGTTVLAIVSALTDTQISQALIHNKNPTDQHLNTAWTLGALRGLVIGAAVAAIGPVMASFYGDPRLTGVMGVLGLTILVAGCMNPRRVMLQRDLVFHQDFILNVSQKVVVLIVSIGIAYYYRTYWALLLGALAGQIVNVAVSYTIVPFRPRPSFRHTRELFSFSIWLSASQVMNTINWKFDHLIIGKLLGRTDLGFYTVGNTLAQMPTRESVQPLGATLFPAFAKVREDRSRLRHAYRRSQAVITSVALPLGIGVALIAEPLVWLAMGEKWMPAALIIQILASVFAFQTLAQPAQPLAMALGKTSFIFKRDVQLFLIRLPLIVLGVSVDGIRGVLIARVVSGAISVAFNFNIVKRLIGLTYREQFTANTRPIASVLLMFAAIELTALALATPHDFSDHLGTVILLTTVGFVTYLGTIFLLWRLAGCPEGPENEALGLLRTVGARFGRTARDATEPG